MRIGQRASNGHFVLDAHLRTARHLQWQPIMPTPLTDYVAGELGGIE